MNWLAFHVASGASLFSGAVLMMIGVFATGKTKGRARFFAKLAASVGLALILLSSTPFPFWLYVAFIVLFVGWIILESLPRLQASCRILVWRILLIASSFVMAS